MPRGTHDVLRTTLLSPLTPNDSKGVIYILHDPDNPEYGYKIGRTKQRIVGRRKQHESCCKFTADIIYASPAEVPYHVRVEALIKADLAHLCKPRPCEGAPINGHTEYFAVSEAVAEATVKQWVQFMVREKPYSSNGDLGFVWRSVLQQRFYTLVTRDTRRLSHKIRREQWNRILAPLTPIEKWIAYLEYGFGLIGATCCSATKIYSYSRMFFWQLSAILYGLYTMFLYQNRVVLYVFVVVLGCATVNVVSKVPHAHLPKKKSQTTPRKKGRKSLGETTTSNGDEETA